MSIAIVHLSIEQGTRMLTRSYIALAFALSGCAHQGIVDRNAGGAEPHPSKAPSHPIQVAGAVLTIPNASKWTVIEQNTGYIKAVWLVSRAPLYSRVILIDQAMRDRDFADANDFHRLAESHVSSVLKQAVSGYELIKKSRQTLATADCLFWRVKAATTDPVNRPNTKLVLDRWEYVCRHPTKARTIVAFQYSERFELGQDVGNIASRAEKVFQSISFSQ